MRSYGGIDCDIISMLVISLKSTHFAFHHNKVYELVIWLPCIKAMASKVRGIVKYPLPAKV